MLCCRHPNVVTLYDAFVVKHVYYLVMERAAESVRQLVQRHGVFRNDMVVTTGLQLLNGVERVHRCGIVHRDLRIDNIFYFNTPGGIVLKISDFGISRELAEQEGRAYTRIGRG